MTTLVTSHTVIFVRTALTFVTKNTPEVFCSVDILYPV
jgi:hypothetical protein